jgi:hypothetical protein
MPQDLTAFVPQVWSKRVLTKLDRTNVMLRLVNRNYEGEIKQAGDTVWVRTFGNVTMSAYRRGAPISYGDLAPTRESLQINDAQNFAFAVDELDIAQNDLNALDGYTDRAAVAINNLVEDKCLSFYASAPTANQVIYDSTASLVIVRSNLAAHTRTAIAIDKTNAYTTLVAASKALNKQNAPREGRWVVVGPTYEAALITDTTYFIRATDMGDRIVQSGSVAMGADKAPGYLGRAAGFDVYGSNALPSDAGGTYAQYGAGPVISYAGQIRKIQRITRESTWADAVRGLILHDGTVFAEHAKGFGTIYYTES